MGVDVKCFRLNRDLSFVAEPSTCELQLHKLVCKQRLKILIRFLHPLLREQALTSYPLLHYLR